MVQITQDEADALDTMLAPPATRIKLGTIIRELQGTASKRNSVYDILIAPHDAPESMKAGADYVCEGANDQLIINAALAEVKATTLGYGTVYLLNGTYLISDAIKMQSYVELRGQSLINTAIMLDLANLTEDDFYMIESASPLNTWCYVLLKELNLATYDGEFVNEQPTNCLGVYHPTLRFSGECERVLFQAGTNPITIENCEGTNIFRECVMIADNMGMTTIDIINTSYVEFIHCTVFGSDIGIKIDTNSKGSIIHGCKLEVETTMIDDFSEEARITGCASPLNLIEEEGVATVLSGTTSIDVGMNLVNPPLIQDIVVTPTNDLGSATKFWITKTGVYSYAFTIHVDADPGEGGATFAWSAKANFNHIAI